MNATTDRIQTVHTESTLQWEDRGDGVLTILGGRAAIKWSPRYRAWIVNVLLLDADGGVEVLHGMQDTEAEAKVLATEWLMTR